MPSTVRAGRGSRPKPTDLNSVFLTWVTGSQVLELPPKGLEAAVGHKTMTQTPVGLLWDFSCSKRRLKCYTGYLALSQDSVVLGSWDVSAMDMEGLQTTSCVPETWSSVAAIFGSV